MGFQKLQPHELKIRAYRRRRDRLVGRLMAKNPRLLSYEALRIAEEQLRSDAGHPDFKRHRRAIKRQHGTELPPTGQPRQPTSEAKQMALLAGRSDTAPCVPPITETPASNQAGETRSPAVSQATDRLGPPRSGGVR